MDLRLRWRCERSPASEASIRQFFREISWITRGIHSSTLKYYKAHPPLCVPSEGFAIIYTGPVTYWSISRKYFRVDWRYYRYKGHNWLAILLISHISLPGNPKSSCKGVLRPKQPDDFDKLDAICRQQAILDRDLATRRRAWDVYSH